MSAVYARAGDVFFTHSNSVLGRLIRWGETDPGETNGTWANHTGVVVEDGFIGEQLDTLAGIPHRLKQAVVVEALWRTRRGPLELGRGTEVRVFRPVPAYGPEELARFVAAAESYVGDKYGWWKLLVQLADRLVFRGRKVLTTGLHVKGRPICSFLAANTVYAAESLERTVARLHALGDPAVAAYAFGIPPQSADPDEMMDFCLTHPQLWEEVR